MSEGIGVQQSKLDGIKDSTKSSTWDVLTKRSTWDDFFNRTPCVRSSYLWGVGCGSLMIAHKLRIYRGGLRHAISAGLLTFVAVSSISFMSCAHEVNEKYRKRLAIQQAMKEQSIQAIGEKAHGQ